MNSTTQASNRATDPTAAAGTPSAATETMGQAARRGREQAAGSSSDIASDARRAVEEQYREAAARAEEVYDRTSRDAEEGYRGARERAASAAREVDRRTRDARESVATFVDEHPLMVGVIGFASGLLIGALLPRSRREDRYFGGWRGPHDRTSSWYVGNEEDPTFTDRPEDIERRSGSPHGHGGGTGRVSPG